MSKSTLIHRITAALVCGALLAPAVGAVSLWGNAEQNAQGPGLFNTPDRQYKVGDIIMIRIDENTRADHKWKAERDKEWKVDATADDPGAGAGTHNLFGLWLPFMNMDYKSEFKSDNNSDRSTIVAAKVSAEVVNVLPNGNLQIVARKVIRVNSDEQLIELFGNIRPEDISAANVVSSTAVADARIKVNGTMRFMQDQKPGILERIFSFVLGTLT